MASWGLLHGSSDGWARTCVVPRAQRKGALCSATRPLAEEGSRGAGSTSAAAASRAAIATPAAEVMVFSAGRADLNRTPLAFSPLPPGALGSLIRSGLAASLSISRRVHDEELT